MLIARWECDQRHAPPEPTAPADFADFSARPSFEPAPYRQKSLNGAELQKDPSSQLLCRHVESGQIRWHNGVLAMRTAGRHPIVWHRLRTIDLVAQGPLAPLPAEEGAHIFPMIDRAFERGRGNLSEIGWLALTAAWSPSVQR
jgi:hypothetical protein